MSNKIPSKSPVLFFDRDGTINVDIGPYYISQPAQLQLIPGAGRAIARAAAAGFRIALITNQAGVAKGHTPIEALPKIHRRLEELIAAEAGLADFRFDDVRVCVHHPDERCKCRKPETQMLVDSIEALEADVERSFFVGDKDSDLLCAKRVGMRSILVLTGHGKATESLLSHANHVVPTGVEPSLAESVELAISLNLHSKAPAT